MKKQTKPIDRPFVKQSQPYNLKVSCLMHEIILYKGINSVKLEALRDYKNNRKALKRLLKRCDELLKCINSVKLEGDCSSSECDELLKRVNSQKLEALRDDKNTQRTLKLFLKRCDELLKQLDSDS